MEIENYREQAPGASLIAIFDVYLPKMQFRMRNIRLIRTKKGHLILGFPSFATEQPDGSKKWTPYFEWSQEKGKEFSDKVVEALKPFARG